jgi:hypothetical protein
MVTLCHLLFCIVAKQYIQYLNISSSPNNIFQSGIPCFSTIRIFTKTLMMNDVMEYTKNENFKYLVIKASHGNYYGFNLRVKMEQTYAMKIVSPDEPDDFMVVGWKVAKKLPMWVCNANSWIDFINRK